LGDCSCDRATSSPTVDRQHGRDGSESSRHLLVSCIDSHVNARLLPDPLQWVISKNLKWRHLDESQRGMAMARLATLPKAQISIAQLRYPHRRRNWPPTCSTSALILASALALSCESSRSRARQIGGCHLVRITATAGRPETALGTVFPRGALGDLGDGRAATAGGARRLSNGTPLGQAGTSLATKHPAPSR